MAPTPSLCVAEILSMHDCPPWCSYNMQRGLLVLVDDIKVFYALCACCTQDTFFYSLHMEHVTKDYTYNIRYNNGALHNSNTGLYLNPLYVSHNITQGLVQHTYPRVQLLEIESGTSTGRHHVQENQHSPRKTCSRLTAMSSSNTEAAMASCGAAVTHGHSPYIVLFKGPDHRSRLIVIVLHDNTGK